jgi:hypothetical protein
MGLKRRAPPARNRPHVCHVFIASILPCKPTQFKFEKEKKACDMIDPGLTGFETWNGVIFIL